ncbi:predicted protein [Naegleria gruberi]|uniref:Predicted protein n=1 Tax=Naegleria gruberi TaxID=5762 RepID=D2VKE2_NAEGR|nr:uncharacterized protein NAEGRDRAFT_50273 [Naegleria gruberi]EFC42584.1 predicted protein [Naegleria gruberi]|eukprot:XP_002675328.1 predicted protein [Naegleria gruberi strain NEG-M]
MLFSIFITDKNKQYTAQQIETTKEKIISSEKTKYIANLSHEARNPLHAISGSISILKHNIQSEECSNQCPHCYVTNGSIAELVEDLEENTTLLEHIFSSSLQVSSLEMGKVELKVEDTNMLCLVESITSVFSQLAKTKQLSLHSYFNVIKVPIFLRADSVRVSQVVMNLISNAIKYTDKGHIKLNCDTLSEREIRKHFPTKSIEEYEFIKIECIDTGKGIPEAQVKDLFKPFHVVEQGQKSVDSYIAQTEKMAEFKDINGASMLLNTSRSNGLGLSISKMLIDKMEGDIIVSSSSKGTNMTIILPLRRVKPEVLKEELVQKNNNYLTCDKIFEILNEENERLNIIIIDEDRFFRHIMLSYWKMFKRAVHISAEYKTSIEFCDSELDKDLMQNTTVIFCPEKDIKHTESNFKHERVVLIPTICRGSHRLFSDRIYLSKPVKFIDLLEFVYEHIFDRTASSTHRQSVVEIEKIPKIMKTKSVPVIEEFKSEKKVLIVDDNHLNLKILEKLLRILGFEDIEVAHDGMECFNKYKKKNYDIILLDCIMPILSGKESCELIRNMEKQEHLEHRIPILAITANVWEDRESLISQGFDSVIYKPIQLEKLQAEMMALLDD